MAKALTKKQRLEAQATAIDALALGRQAAEVCEQLGITLRTFQRWREDPEFDQACERAIAAAEGVQGIADPTQPLVVSQETARLRRLQADKLELEIKRTRGLLLDRIDVEGLLQEVVSRVDRMDGEANWVRLQRLYDVPYDESKDYWVPEIKAVVDSINQWLEDRIA